MKYYIVDAFSDKPFGGNPAGVVLLGTEDYPAEELMLKIAAELRYSETVFIQTNSSCEYTARYFTPSSEVDLCGHATVAAFHLMHHEGIANGKCILHTMAGDIMVDAAERVMMQMATPRIASTLDGNDIAETYRAVGIENYQPMMPVQTAYSGLIDIMLPIADVATLNALQPDMKAVCELTRRLEVVSIHAFAFSSDNHTAHVRDFAPLYGIDEEAATGTANAALTHYLQQNGCLGATAECTFLQGETMGRPSVVATRLDADGRIYVGGTAAIVAEGNLLL